MLLRSSTAPIIFISPSSPPDTGQQRRDATHRDVREGFAGRRDFAATVSNPSGKKGNDLIHFRSEKKRHAVLAVTAVGLTRWWSIIDQAKPIADDSLGHGGGGAEVLNAVIAGTKRSMSASATDDIPVAVGPRGGSSSTGMWSEVGCSVEGEGGGGDRVSEMNKQRKGG